MPYTVAPANTFTVLTAAPPSPSQYLQPVAFTATVSGANGGSPTGTVDFTSDGQPISADCTGVQLIPQVSGSTATCVTTALSVAPSHQILATYNATPNGNFNGSASNPPLSYEVDKAGTTTSLTAIPPNKSTYLQDIQFTATVTGNFGGSPTGTVSFTSETGAIPNCTGLPLTSLLSLKKGKAQRSGSGGKGSPQDNGSAATCDVPQGLPLGQHMIQATYDPGNDPDFTGSPSKMLPYEVDAAGTTTVLTAAPPSPSQYLQPVTFTATVSGANGGSPLGTVTFTDSVDGQLCGGPVSLVPQQTGSTATCALTSLSVTPNHQIVATYNGDDPGKGFNGSASNPPLSYEVDKAGTTTTLTAIPANKSTYLQDIQFTATVTGNFGGSPTGTVSFTSDSAPIDNCSNLPLTSLLSLKKGKAQRSGSGGKGSPQDNGSAATCDVPKGLALGQHTIQATYDPGNDPDFSGSASKMLPYEVDAAGTTTVLTAVPASPSQYLQPVTFTATVSGANGGSPLGTVTFTDSVDGQLCGGPVSLVPQQTGSTATCAITSLSVTPNHQIVATYNGDDPGKGFNGSASQQLPYEVDKAGTTTTLTAAPPSPSGYLQDIQFTATVTGTYGGNPTGTVEFQSDSQDIPNCTGMSLMSLKKGKAQVSGAGGKGAPQGDGLVATCDVPTGLAVGSHKIQAIYKPGNDPDFNDSMSLLLLYTVAKATTTIPPDTFTSSPNSSTYPEPVTITAAVKGQYGGTPTGTMDFADAGNAIPGCTGVQLQNATGTCITQALSAGTHSQITATYSGDDNFANSNATLPKAQVVMKAATTTTFTSIVPDPSQGSGYLQTVTFNVQVTGAKGGSPTETVSVQELVKNSPVLVCTVTLVPSNGGSTGSCQSSSLTVGQHTIQAVYNGDGNYQQSPATSPIGYLVSQASTTTTLSSGVQMPTVNQPVAIVAIIIGSNSGAPTGNVEFDDVFNGVKTMLCAAAKLVPQASQSTATCTTSVLVLGTHNNITTTYLGDGNFGPSNGKLQPGPVVQQGTTMTATPLSSLNSPVYGQAVTFTASVSPGYPPGSAMPTGMVTFYADGTKIVGCELVGLNSGTGQALCATTASPASGDSFQITAVYNGDGNFTPSPLSSPLVQPVEDFVPQVTSSDGLTAGVVTVTQSYNSTTDPFSPQTITFNATPINGFSNPLMLSCPNNGQGPTCSSFPVNPVTFPIGSPLPTVVISAGSTPVGIYPVTISATDTVTGLTRPAMAFNVLVGSNSPTLTVAAGQPGITTVPFVGVSPVTAYFMCKSVQASGTNNAQDPSTIGLSCTFNNSPTTLSIDPAHPTEVQVTVSILPKTGRLMTAPRIFAALWLGMPAIVLVGSLRFGKLTRRRIWQLMGMLLVLVALLQGIGCGGGFNRGSSNTPAGSYQLLIEGRQDSTTGPVQTSAVVPITVLQ